VADTINCAGLYKRQTVNCDYGYENIFTLKLNKIMHVINPFNTYTFNGI